MFTFKIDSGPSFADTDKVIINSSFSYLYKDQSLTEHYDFKISGNKILECVSEYENCYEVICSVNENEYLGYIPAEIASPYVPQQESILVYNGQILRETKVYSITDGSDLEIILNVGHKIYLYEGFNAKLDYTKIKFEFEGEILTGKVLTKDLSPNGINKAVIISLSIIVALVSVVLILLGLSKKKWHTPLKKRKK